MPSPKEVLSILYGAALRRRDQLIAQQAKYEAALDRLSPGFDALESLDRIEAEIAQIDAFLNGEQEAA